MTLSLPSKTFIMGEYLALHGGSALIAGSHPSFSVKYAEVNGAKGSGQEKVFSQPSEYGFIDLFSSLHPKSPAYQYWQKNKNLVSSWRISFSDPHNGAGGFGASGAQFLALYFLDSFLKAEPCRAEVARAELIAHTLGVPSSGYDVLSQLTGGLSHVSSSKNIRETLSWNLKNLGFVIVRTGLKVSTHDHLKQLPDIPVADLQKKVDLGMEYFNSKQEKNFLQAVEGYFQILIDLELIQEESVNLLQDLKLNFSEVLGGKACGAAGADTLMLFVHPENRLNLCSKLKSKNVAVVATDLDLIKPKLESNKGKVEISEKYGFEDFKKGSL